jgi:hypothetical protein
MVAIYNAEEDLAGAYTTLDLYQQSQAGMME